MTKDEALNKKAENARELGLDYEPVAPVQEDWGPGPHECHSLTAAPVQEPVGEVNRYGLDSHGRKWHGIYWYDANVDVPHGTKLYTTKPAQPAPVQEPVGWLTQARNLVSVSEFTEAEAKLYGWTPVYITPPAAQRQWVGLTDAEVMQIMSGDWTSQFYFARAIEDKLKEKNT
jgi:hypothetical protein